MGQRFENFKLAIGRKVAVTFVGIMNQSEKVIIKTDIQKLQKEIVDAKYSLGDHYYELFKEGGSNDTYLIELCKDIIDTEKLIEELEKDLIINEMNSQKTLNRLKGTSTLSIEHKEDSSTNVLPCQCGHINLSGVNFCSHCGKKIEEEILVEEKNII